MKINLIILLFLLISQVNMEDNRYELLLGTDINKVKFNAEEHFNNENKYSWFFFISSKTYFNNSINTIFINVDDDKKIKQIDIELASLVDQKLYNTLIKIYGEPNMILVPNKVLYEKTFKGKKSNSTIKKTKTQTRQGDFKDNPTFIIWEKKNYKIELLMKYPQNTSEVSFKKI